MKWQGDLNQLKPIQDKLIGIAGAGGIGSNVARFLVQVGFKRLKIVDFDRVEQSNLNRQFYFKDQIGQIKVEALKANLTRLNSDIEVEPCPVLLDSKNSVDCFAGCSVVVEALDKKESKRMLIDTLASRYSIVAVSGIAGSDLSLLKTKRLSPRLQVVGDFQTDEEDSFLLGYKVSVCSAMMCEAVIESLLNGVRAV